MAQKLKCTCRGVIVCTGTITHKIGNGEYLIIRYRRCQKCKKVFKTFEKIKVEEIPDMEK